MTEQAVRIGQIIVVGGWATLCGLALFAVSKPSALDSGCTAGYSPCIPNRGADYDCGGRNGNGPYFTPEGVVYTVTGTDPYALDHDDDGLGCER